MIIVMKPNATEAAVQGVEARLQELGFGVHRSEGVQRRVLGAIGDKTGLDLKRLERLEGVERIIEITQPYKLVHRDFREEGSRIPVGPTVVGDGGCTVMAGPCAVESRDQVQTAARGVAEAGASVLRGGAFKPRTSPYSFQGLGDEGLQILAEARDQTGLPVITEVMSPETVEAVAQAADVLQIGARNMQNFPLLKAAGRTDRPVLLKRGLSATIKEWLMAAEYIMSEGNQQVMLCERGIRTFNQMTRNTLDLSVIPVLKQQTHLPVIIDPSHATGDWRYVAPMARAALAAGADGLLIEVHPWPDEALCDGQQSLTLERFAGLMAELQTLGDVLHRPVTGLPQPAAKQA